MNQYCRVFGLWRCETSSRLADGTKSRRWLSLRRDLGGCHSTTYHWVWLWCFLVGVRRSQSTWNCWSPGLIILHCMCVVPCTICGPYVLHMSSLAKVSIFLGKCCLLTTDSSIDNSRDRGLLLWSWGVLLIQRIKLRAYIANISGMFCVCHFVMCL